MKNNILQKYICLTTYSVFHRFRQSKFAYGGSILNLSQFSLLPQQPLKMTLAIKVVKIDSKLIISLLRSESVKQTVTGVPSHLS